MCAKQRLRSACAADQSYQSSVSAQLVARDHRLLHSNSDGSDKLGEYQGESESSRGTHDFVCLVSCSGSNTLKKL